MHLSRLVAVCAAFAAVPGFLPAVVKGDAAKGKEVFEAYCLSCHNATSDAKKVGPGLKGLFKKEKLVTGQKANEASIRAKIENGGNGMPAYRDLLSDEEKENLIAYLKTL